MGFNLRIFPLGHLFPQILTKVTLEPLIKDIDEGMETAVLPSYMNASTTQMSTTQKAANKQTTPLIKDAIWGFLNGITEDSVHSVSLTI